MCEVPTERVRDFVRDNQPLACRSLHIEARIELNDRSVERYARDLRIGVVKIGQFDDEALSEPQNLDAGVDVPLSTSLLSSIRQGTPSCREQSVLTRKGFTLVRVTGWV